MLKKLAFLIPFIFSVSTLSSRAVEIMPLSDVKIGSEGVWKTVVKGSELSTFPFKVLGVSKNFAGPRQPVIICEALDEENQLSGPVSGMSGSPVYIDGKLVGAYAYGYLWPKKQAIFGVTPIENMLEVVERYEPQPNKKPRMDKHMKGKLSDYAPETTSVHLDKDSKVAMEDLEMLRPLPSPFFAGGFSQKTLDFFQEEFDKVGVKLVSTSTASTSTADTKPLPMDAGYPIAGVLMDGDFDFSGVGTITWREGDRVLGFGHPFFQAGDVQIPMAGAEIITIVRNLSSSFKLANTGPVVGAIYQDRLTAIAGEVGMEVPTTKYSVSVVAPDGKEQNYQGNVCEHPYYSPLLSAMALYQSLTETMESEDERTFYVTQHMEIEGYGDLDWEWVAVDSREMMFGVIDFLRRYQTLMNNRFAYPRVKEVTTKVIVKDEIIKSSLREVYITSGPPESGEDLGVSILLDSHLGESRQVDIDIPLPINGRNKTFELFVGDSVSADLTELGSYRGDWKSLEDIINAFRKQRSNRYCYVQLRRSAEGIRLQGTEMADLPPSIMKLYENPRNAQYGSVSDQVVIWEKKVEVPGGYVGRYFLNVIPD